MNKKVLFSTIENEFIGGQILAKAQTIDQNANGIQINGAENVTKIALGVSCNLEFLQKAVAWGAQACIFHHGLSLSSKYLINSRLLPYSQSQLRYIFAHDITVAGYHYVLDTHPTIGNNAQIIQQLGAIQTSEEYYDGWGWIAEFEQEKYLEELASDCSKIFKHDIFIIKGNRQKVKRLGVCSGGAIPQASNLWEMLDKNIDLHLTGEINEGVSSKCNEMNLAYFACGHYATEVFGVKALGEEIKKKFPELEVEFIDVWNEL